MSHSLGVSRPQMAGCCRPLESIRSALCQLVWQEGIALPPPPVTLKSLTFPMD